MDIFIFFVAYYNIGSQSYERLFYLFLSVAYPVVSIFAEKRLKQKKLGRFLSINFATITLPYAVIWLKEDVNLLYPLKVKNGEDKINKF